MSTADPAGKSTYEANAKAYLAKLDALEQEVKAAIGKIPADRRRIITTHDAFGYFGGAYGMEFIAPQGVSTDSEPSAKDVARIIAQIRKQKIPAVFMENITDPRLMQQIAKETGAKIGGTLYSDALSEPGGPAATYIDMMRSNVRETELRRWASPSVLHHAERGQQPPLVLDVLVQVRRKARAVGKIVARLERALDDALERLALLRRDAGGFEFLLDVRGQARRRIAARRCSAAPRRSPAPSRSARRRSTGLRFSANRPA